MRLWRAFVWPVTSEQMRNVLKEHAVEGKHYHRVPYGRQGKTHWFVTPEGEAFLHGRWPNAKPWKSPVAGEKED